MPTPLPSTFASAAASTNGENPANKRDNTSTSDWSRKVNGTTHTFRRPSQAATPSHPQSQTQARDANSSVPANNGDNVYLPPHLASRSSYSSRPLPTGETRYNKDQLLSIYESMRASSTLDQNLDSLFVGPWSVNANGRLDGKEPGPEVCWNSKSDTGPFGLIELTEEEKQLFSTSVNPPAKPQQATTREGGGVGVIGRKASLSNYNNAASTSRPGTRRREPSDSYVGGGPLSPAENKTFFRGDSNTATPPPALLRRRTDYKDEESTPTSKEELDSQENPEAQSHFPGIRRAGTGPLSAGLNAPSASPWSAATQTGGFGSMGSFGSFAIGSAPTPNESADKRPGFGSARGGSRFKDLLSKASSEDIHQGLKDKSSFGALEKLPEEDLRASQLGQRAIGFGTRPGRSETNPYEEVPDRTGSAVLGGSQDGQPNPVNDNLGFPSHGPPPNVGTRDLGHDDHYQQTPYGRFNPHDPMSPTNTNPYQSPHARPDDDEQESGEPASQAPGSQPVGASRRNVFPGPDDRGLGSMRGAGGFGNIGFGSLGGPMWSGANPGAGKPALDRTIGSAFGDPIFSPLGDLQSPGGGLGGGFFGASGFGSQGRASRLGAMFPPAMQEQMRGDSRNELHQGPLDSRPDSAQQHTQRDPFDPAGRRPEGFTGGSNRFDDSPPLRNADDPVSSQGQQSHFVAPQPSLPTPQAVNQRASSGGDNFQAGHGLSQSSGSNSSNQMPAAQQRQMVMPDRMRWIYRDPQGNTQGPWSGLEMHDWFKAGFFTAELQVKKLEDTDYEPLAQLVRRIGNSREPFLVPQIGVPHGPPSGGQGNHWANPANSSAAQSGSAPGGGATQPPFASSFPSFGTTLTAEQQNALERRKQEEQFLMARQKEHLAQQQIAMKHLQYQNGLHSLQHQPSAHSLQSQPSFGSMTSPAAYQQSPMPAPIQPPQQQAPPLGQTGLGMGLNYGRDNEIHGMMDRLSFNQRTGPSSFPGGVSGQAPTDSGPSQHVSSMLQDRARLQQQQHQPSEMRDHEDTFLGPQGRNDRLEEFRTLQREGDTQAGRLGPESQQQAPQPIGAQRRSDDPSSASITQKGASAAGVTTSKLENESLSLAQQIQIAAASQQAAAEESAWAKKDTYVEPPPVSISPLPAPAAQRNRLHVADALAAESRSATQTPIETPSVSVAPWAERTVEHPKGPSLKEIQEAEAKRAAEQEELMAAARRAQAEQERLLQAQAPAAAPGLPSSSTWGSSSSPVAASNTSVWAKQASAKPATSNSKKTLAQIQKEEESRKQRAAAATAAAAAAASSHASPGGQTGSAPGSGPAGKRYAELASKAIPAVPLAPNSAWMTVGSGGKTKAPPAVVATPQPAPRTASGSAATVAKPRPANPTSRSTTGSNQNKAGEEFSKWIKASLGKGLNSNINVDSFVQDLLMLPPEVEIISDSVYASSQTLDGRRFAEEFVRRRKLADKGIVEPAASGPQVGGSESSSGGGGWSEVAKKGPVAKEDNSNNAAFKVVPTKKKAAKR